MEQIFLEIISMSITAGYCILVVLFLRLLIRKLPKIYSYMLWIVVGFRLVSPFSIKSAFSLVQMVPQDVTEQIVNLEQSPIPTISETSEISVLSDEIKNQSDMALQNYGKTLPQNVWQGESISAYGQSFSMNPLQLVLEIAVVVWIIGVIFLIIYSVWTMFRLKKKLRDAACVEGNIYRVENLPTPFVFGTFKPRIYLPETLLGEDRKFVLLHEQTHIRRRDYLIKQISYFIVCVHWFNPLVWLAYNFMCQDMEMSCDESVIRRLGKEQKAQYSATLLSLASGKKIALGSPLAFGEGGIKKRIVNVLNYKRPAFWVSVGLIIVLAIILLGLSLNPREKADLDSEIVEQEQPISLEEVQIASGEMHMGNGSQITVEFWMTEGVYFDDEHDAPSIYVYEENYKGNYELRTFDEAGNLRARLDLRDVLEGAYGDVFNFPGEFTILEADYNEDGCPDFTIGQTGSSSINFYALLTIRKDGTIEKLCEKEIACSENVSRSDNNAFSIVFRHDTSKEQKPILVSIWNNVLGEAEESRYVWNEETGMYEEAEPGANGEPLNPDAFSQAIYYQGYLDESPYTMWNTGWNNCDFDGDGTQDRVYREVNEQDGEITYRIDFGNSGVLEVARTGDYFMWPKIKSADICGDENREILFVGEHSLSTSPDADVMLYEKTENGYEEIPLIHPREWFGNLDGTVYLYSGDEPITDALGPAADFVEQFDWNSWCENEAREQLHFGTYEETGRTAVDADFINYEGSPCLILYHNIGDKWLYKEIGFVFRIGENTGTGIEREIVLEKIVADGLQYGEIYSNMSWLGEPEFIIPVDAENVIANKGYYVGLKYKGLEVTMNTSDNFQLLPSSSVHSITITGNDLLALGSFPVGTSKSEIMQEYQLNESAFLTRSQNFPEGEDGAEVYRIENDGIRECSVPEYDTFCVIKEPDNPVALIYLLKDETVNAVLVRHLTAD